MRVVSKSRWVKNKWSIYAAGVVGAVLVVLSAVFLVRLVNAAPAPSVSFTEADETPMIGEQTTFTLRFDNSGDQAGFGPYVDLVLPEDFSNPSVSYLGQSLNVQPIGPFPAGMNTCLNHPLVKQSSGAPVEVCLNPTKETTLFVIKLPFGSFTDTQSAADLQVTVNVAAGASITNPQTLSARGGFYLGSDALNNPTSDPSISPSSFADAEVQPTVLKLRKQYIPTVTDGSDDTESYLKNEYEIVPGDNHKQRFRITADVADGATVSGLSLQDVLPSPLVRVAQVDATPAGFADTSTGNTAKLEWSSITGTTNAVDARFDIVFEVPYKDGGNAITWTRSIDNEATVDASYGGTPLSQITEPIRGDDGGEQQLTIKPMITQKTVTKVGSGIIKPSDTLEYTIRMYLSDYVALDNMKVTDTLPDGLTYQAGTAMVTLPGATPTVIADPTNTPGANDSDVLVFDLSGTTLVGGCIPMVGTGGADPDCDTTNRDRTIVTLTFRAQINETYTGGQTVFQGNTLDNHVSTTADMRNPTDLSSLGQSSTDGSNARVRIAEGSLAKTIYAVNGSTSIPSRLKPGDDVTYRLQYTVPNTDFGSLQIDDNLPLPMFSAASVNTFDNTYPYSGTAPAAGTASFGPADTLYGYSNEVPDISHPGGNVVRFSWDEQSDNPGNHTRTIDILFTVKIGNQPYAPGLFITNQATSNENNVTSTATNTVINSIEMEIPEPSVSKGVVQTTASNPAPVYTPSIPSGLTFSAPGSAGTRFTGTIADSASINSNLSGVDAGDIVTYAFVVENTGKGDIYNARLRDQLPTDMQIPAGGRNLRVTDGTGNPLNYTDNGGSAIFDITLNDAVPNDTTLPGQNVVVVTYDLEVAHDVQPRDEIVNTAQLTHFAAENGGVNYVVDQSQYEDEATVTAKPPVMTKAITGTALGDTTGNDVVVGEEITYTVTMTVPEGTMTNAVVTDTLDACLAVTNLTSLTASAGVTSSNGTMSAVLGNAQVQNVGGGAANDGRRIVLNFGTLTNSNSSNTDTETVTLVYRAVPINAGTCANTNTRNNDVTLGWNSGSDAQTLTASSPNVTIREPLVTVAKTFTPTSGDANDVTRVRLTVTTAAAPRTPAYDVSLSDILSSTHFDYAGNLTHVSGVAPTSSGESGGTVAASWSQLNPGQSSVIEFDVHLNASYASGSAHPNSATATWTSYPGAPSGLTTYNSLAVERTGNTGDVGGAENDHRATGNASYTLSNVSNLNKSIVETSESHTTSSNVTIGEIVRYRLSAQVPESTTNNVVLRDVLPAGLEYLGHPRAALVGNDGMNTITSSTITGAFVSGNSSNVVPAADIPGTAMTVTGQQVDFNIGTLTNNDNDGDNEYIVIEFNALVRNSVGNIRGSDINNQFTVRVGGVQQGNPSNIVTATVQEPNVTIQKSVTQAPVDAGDLVTYQISIANPTIANGLTGYDLQFTDTLDEHLEYVSSDASGSSVPVTPQHTVNGSGRDIITVPINQLGQSQTVSFTITARVKNSAPASYTVPNTGEVTTTTLPGVNGTTSNPTGQATPGATDAANGERRYSTSDDANTSLGDPSITKTRTGAVERSIGTTIEYPITVTVPQGVTQNVIVTDNLPVGLAYVSHSANTSTLPSGSIIANPQANWRTQPTSAPGASGQDAVFNLGTISVPGDSGQNASFTITVTARVLDIPANVNGTTVQNSATLRYTHPDDGPTDITTSPVPVQIQEPRLALTKTLAGTGLRNVGDTLNYTIDIENTGFATAYDWHVDDILPSHTSISATPTCTLEGSSISVNHTVAGGAMTITPTTGTSIAVGETVQCQYSLTINSTAVIGSTYTNTADVDWHSGASSEPDVRGYNDASGSLMDQDQDTDDASFTMTGAGFTKTVDKPVATIGEVRTYTLTINAPNGVVQNLVVEDVLPAGLEFISTTNITNIASVAPGISAPNNGTAPVTVTWDFGTVSHNGQPITIEYQARVANVASNQDGQARSNQAEVRFTPQGNDPVIEESDVTITVEEPELTISKAANRTAARYGQEVTYTLTIDHHANSSRDAYDLEVADTLPAGMTLVGGSINAPGWSVTPNATGFTATRNSLGLTAGALEVTYQARVNAPPASPLATLGDSLTNNARLTWTSLEGAAAGERTGAGAVNDYGRSDDIDLTAQAINLAIAKSTASTQTRPGESITYNLEVRNTGNVAATDVVITEIVPQHTAFTGTPAGWVCENSGAAGSTCTYDLGDMAAGATQTVQFTVTVDTYNDLAATATAIDNHVRVAASDENGVETTMSDNEDDVNVPLEVADIGVTKEDDVDPVLHINDDFNYTITVTNHSNTTTATNVRIYDELPEGITFNSVNNSDCTEVSGIIDCIIPSIDAGDSVVIIINVTGNKPGRVVNEVTVRADQQDTNRNNNRDEEVTLIDPADLEIVKRADRSSASFDTTITYTLDITNHGPDTATDVTVVDALPNGLQLVSVESAQGACTTSGQQVRCNLGTLNNQARTSITVKAKADRIGSLANRATVSSNEYDPNLTNNESDVVVTVLPLAPNTGVGRTGYGGAIVLVTALLAALGVKLYRRRRA